MPLIGTAPMGGPNNITIKTMNRPKLSVSQTKPKPRIPMPISTSNKSLTKVR